MLWRFAPAAIEDRAKGIIFFSVRLRAQLRVIPCQKCAGAALLEPRRDGHFDPSVQPAHTAQSDDRNQSASRSSMANGVPPWLRLLVILLDMPPAWSVFSKQPGAFASAPRLGASHGHHPPYRARSALAGQTVSLNNRRKRAGWNVDYLETVIRADRITFKRFAWLRPLAPSKGRAFAIHPFG